MRFSSEKKDIDGDGKNTSNNNRVEMKAAAGGFERKKDGGGSTEPKRNGSGDTELVKGMRRRREEDEGRVRESETRRPLFFIFGQSFPPH